MEWPVDSRFWPAGSRAARLLAGLGSRLVRARLAILAAARSCCRPALMRSLWPRPIPAEATALWLAALATCPEMWLGDLIGRVARDHRHRQGDRAPAPAGALPAALWRTVGWRATPDSPSCLMFLCRGRCTASGPACPWRIVSAAWSARPRPSPSPGHGWRPAWCTPRDRRPSSPHPSSSSSSAPASPAAGLRPLYSFRERGAAAGRLLTHPAFLAGFALISVYALLLEQVRGSPRLGSLAVLGGDLVILLATGARAPLALALLMILLVAGVRADARAGPGLRAAYPILLAIIVPHRPCRHPVAAPLLGFVRLLSLASQGDVTDLSNRTVIWPVYEAAFGAIALARLGHRIGQGFGAGGHAALASARHQCGA